MPNFRMTESFSALESIVKTSATFQAWYHFFDALRPLAYHYQTRFEEFITWDRAHDLPSPISPVHSLNFYSLAYDAIERYGSYSPGVDEETDRMFSLLSAGARLDLSLYLSESDLLEGVSAGPKSRRVRLREEQELHRYRVLVDEHTLAINALQHDCETFEDADIGSCLHDHLRCCGDKMRMMSRGLAATLRTTQRGVYFLDFVRALHTDSGRASVCEECLGDLDGLVSQSYDQWWRAVSPLIRDISLPDTYEDELDR